MRRFQEEPDLRVFLLSARAGGLGLNLQAADTVVLFDMDWNPQNDRQAIARVHRVGQEKEVRVVRLLSDCKVERHIEARCQEKLEMERKIMGAGMFRKAVTQDQRRLALREMLGMDGAGETIDGADLTAPEDLSRILARSDEEIVGFQEMDAAIFGPLDASESVAVRIEKAGRLMRSEEVPAGFTCTRNHNE